MPSSFRLLALSFYVAITAAAERIRRLNQLKRAEAHHAALLCWQEQLARATISAANLC
jgi:hypothetical protein